MLVDWQFVMIILIFLGTGFLDLLDFFVIFLLHLLGLRIIKVHISLDIWICIWYHLHEGQDVDLRFHHSWFLLYLIFSLRVRVRGRSRSLI
jgi:hypothetical protein